MFPTFMPERKDGNLCRMFLSALPYVPVGAIVGAIHMQNTISRHRREEEEEAKKKEEEQKSKQDVMPMYFRKSLLSLKRTRRRKNLIFLRWKAVCTLLPVTGLLLV